jgi:hypothetical protein
MARKPSRIAPPAIIADAASALYAQVAACAAVSDEDRTLYENAITKAFAQLMDGVRFDREDDGTFVFPSRSRSGLAHRVNGTCDCEASAEQGQPCWHRAAKRLVLLVEYSTLPDPAPAAPVPDPAPAPAPVPTPAPTPAPLLQPAAGPGRNTVTRAPQPAAPAPQPAAGHNVAAMVQRVKAARTPALSAQEEIDELFPPKR